MKHALILTASINTNDIASIIHDLIIPMAIKVNMMVSTN